VPDWSKDVFSTNASNIAYEEEGGRLIVTWNKGSRRSVYSGVPEDLALQVANAPSVGSILNTEIKPYFQHQYE
jgi:hypothetical protein